MIYYLIGKATVRLSWLVLKRKFVLRSAVLTSVGVVAGVTAVGVVGYLATRDVPEA